MTGMQTHVATTGTDRVVTTAWLNAAIGVAIFAGSLPATRVAVSQLDPLFVTFTRATIAGLLSAALLALRCKPRPGGSDLVPLAIVALGVVIGFPLLTALAMRRIDAAQGLLFLGLLPLMTASFGVLRAGERPRPGFWLCAAAGAVVIASYALAHAQGRSSLSGDALMMAAIVLCGLGYAEGARASRHLGGWQTIAWALVLALPVMLPLAVLSAPDSWAGVQWPPVLGLAYVSLFSMFIGFIFWYRGLAVGGIAVVGQLQLLQPLLGMALAAWLLNEPVGVGLVATSAGSLVCVAGAKRFGG